MFPPRTFLELLDRQGDLPRWPYLIFAQFSSLNVFNQEVAFRSSTTPPIPSTFRLVFHSILILSSMQNPFDAWSAPSSSRRSSDIPPSIYGALPYTDAPAVPGITTFHFACLNPSIINSVILGPDNCPKFHVVTEPSMPGYTILKAVDGGNIGMIQWKPDDSQVEIRGVMRKRAARDFLILSDDQRYRAMRVGGTDYIWTSEQGSTCMYLGGDVSSKMLAKVTRYQSCFRLAMAAEAISAGLLPSAIIAVILLQSGKAY